MRRQRPKLVRLKAPRGDADMAERLLWILGQVRRGRVKGYCVVLITDEDGGCTIEHASADDDEWVEVQLLGAMRLAESGLIERRQERDGETS
jgi:hypothetical protein